MDFLDFCVTAQETCRFSWLSPNWADNMHFFPVSYIIGRKKWLSFICASENLYSLREHFILVPWTNTKKASYIHSFKKNVLRIYYVPNCVGVLQRIPGSIDMSLQIVTDGKLSNVKHLNNTVKNKEIIL